MDKQTLSEKWRSINHNPQEEEQQWITIYHRTTGLPLLYVEGVTLAGVDLEGANLIDADLRSRFEHNLWCFVPILLLFIVVLLPLHLPKVLRQILLAIGTAFVSSRVDSQVLLRLLVDLHGANLRNALLIGADLRGANLTLTDLRGANLFAAQVRGANFNGCHYDETTIWPTGFQPPRRKRALPAVTPEAEGEPTPVRMQ